MNQEAIIEFWGVENLLRWSETALRDLHIPEASKSFLKDVGLPRQDDWTFRFGPSNLIPTIEGKPHCRRIGYSDTSPIYVDELRNGLVAAGEDSWGGREVLINSNVQAFAECLVHYQRYRQAAIHTPEEEIQHVVTRTQMALAHADSAAFASEENWWPLVVEQMNQGML
jgi:hypothetical protein